ncbi:hypothetical protein [uncultured Methanobrevibacter sp.]|uniref:hypothetical protein n=1 Tax=uncultured Methanobrevibacter sp. TaxID=253161 RepID=UPI0025D1914F|nr:hypothetical protein [uncultured Methanobrevibacter sp.]
MKDNNNILTYNIWTCGDYNNLEDFNRYTQESLQITNSYSYIGECSAQITLSGNAYVDVPTNITIEGTYTLTLKILTENWVQLRLLESWVVKSEVNIPPNTDSWQSISLSATFSDLSNIRIRIKNIGSTDRVFFDDVTLIKS